MRPVRVRFPPMMLAFMVVLASAGCASTSSENFYALNDGAAVISKAPAGASSGVPVSALPGVVVSAVTIPEMIDRPQIVTRDSSNRVNVSEQNLWAESIKSGVARTLAARIGRAMSDAGQPVQVGAYPQTSIADPALRVTVDIVRFDAVPNGEALVDATWSIRRPADEYMRTGRTIASSPIAGTGYDAIVKGWNDAVAVVDRDIAAAVLQVGLTPPVSAPVRTATPALPDPAAPAAPRRVPRAKRTSDAGNAH